jgi:hypothetical protein
MAPRRSDTTAASVGSATRIRTSSGERYFETSRNAPSGVNAIPFEPIRSGASAAWSVHNVTAPASTSTR